MKAGKNMKTASLEEQLQTTSVTRLLVRLSLPATAAQMVSALYSVVDRIYISHIPDIGTDALAGLGLCFPLIMLNTAISLLIASGSSALSTIKMGEGKNDEASRLLNGGFTLLVVTGVMLMVLLYAFLRPMLMFFGGSANTLPYAVEYMKIYIAGTIAGQVSLGMNYFINSQGFTRTGMISVVCGAVANIILDPILIFGFNMGIKGAAIATVISQIISAIWVMAFLCSKTPVLRMRRKELKPDAVLMKRGCALGLSNFIFQINESVVVIVLNRLLLKYSPAGLGDIHIAALSIVATLQQFFFMPLKGLVQGSQPIISYSVGARDYPKIHKTIISARALSIACASILWFIFVFFPKPIAEMFTPNAQLAEIAATAVRVSFSTVFVIGMQMINQNSFIAMGNVKYSFIFGLMRKIFLLIPFALILPHFIGVWGVYGAEAVSNVITTIVTYFVFNNYMAKLKADFSNQA